MSEYIIQKIVKISEAHEDYLTKNAISFSQWVRNKLDTAIRETSNGK